MSLLSLLGVPIYFGVVWRRANQTGMWLSLGLGIVSYLTIMLGLTGEGRTFADPSAAFTTSVFVPTVLSFCGMWLGSLLGPADNATKLKRFYVILNTPIGQEKRLVEAGIRLPSLVDAGLITSPTERLRVDVVDLLYEEDSRDKLFGPESNIELRREKSLPWYFPGFVKITLCCIGLVVVSWLVTRMLFVWGANV